MAFGVRLVSLLAILCLHEGVRGEEGYAKEVPAVPFQEGPAPPLSPTPTPVSLPEQPVNPQAVAVSPAHPSPTPLSTPGWSSPFSFLGAYPGAPVDVAGRYPGGYHGYPGAGLVGVGGYPGGYPGAYPGGYPASAVSQDYASRWYGPIAIPVVLPDGTLANTPEVTAARAQHLATLERAKALWYGKYNDGSYNPQLYGDHAYANYGRGASSYTPGAPGYARGASVHTPAAPSYIPAAPAYTPAAPAYTPAAPAYAPAAPAYTPAAPAYTPAAPAYAPAAPVYTPAAPAYAPAAPAYVHGTPVYAPGAPGYAHSAPGYAHGAPGYAPVYAPGSPGYAYGSPNSLTPLAHGVGGLNTPWAGPLASPTVLPSGYLAETPEIVAARTAHLAALSRAYEEAALWRSKAVNKSWK